MRDKRTPKGVCGEAKFLVEQIEFALVRPRLVQLSSASE